MNILGLVPARSGSKRLPNKNMSVLQNETLVARALRIASEASVFAQIACSTDSEAIAQHVKELGFEAILRPPEIATDTSRDVEWVTHAFGELGAANYLPWVDYHYVDVFCILRPTSPFRTSDTIKRAVKQFEEQAEQIDSLRAVQPVSERPEKMWRLGIGYGMMQPYLSKEIRQVAIETGYPPERPWEEQAAKWTGNLYIQNGCIEIAHTHVLPNSVSGDTFSAFFTEGREGVDINTVEDLSYARWLAR